MNESWILFLVAVGLAIDCFSVSICIASSPLPLTPRSIFRLAFHFGFFQGGMTFLGWLLGTSIADYVSRLDHWITFTLLAFIGGKMILEGVRQKEIEDSGSCPDRTRGFSLLMLSVATSIDAFGVGISYAFFDGGITSTSLLIAVVSFLFTIAGLLGGQKIRSIVGNRAEILGGSVLIFIGLRILLTHSGILAI